MCFQSVFVSFLSILLLVFFSFACAMCAKNLFLFCVFWCFLLSAASTLCLIFKICMSSYIKWDNVSIYIDFIMHNWYIVNSKVFISLLYLKLFLHVSVCVPSVFIYSTFISSLALHVLCVLNTHFDFLCFSVFCCLLLQLNGYFFLINLLLHISSCRLIEINFIQKKFKLYIWLLNFDLLNFIAFLNRLKHIFCIYIHFSIYLHR